jgi:hypothetical protein
MRRLVGPNSSRTSRGLLVQWYYIAQPILTIASRNNLVLLGTFITLLQAVAFTSADREALQKLWERLRWQLRIFSRGNELFEGALKRLDEKRTWVENILEKGFTPLKPSREVSRIQQQRPLPLVSPDSNTISGFPGFPTQSMEDLLKTEGLVVHNVHNAHNYADGLLRFEEFSGWDGFDIHDL